MIFVDQSTDAKFFCDPFVSGIDRNILQYFYCRDVHRFCNCISDSNRSEIIVAPPVTDRTTGRVFVRFVYFNTCECTFAHIKCRSVYCKNLETRTWLASTSCIRTVQSAVRCFLTTTTDKCLDMTIRLVDNGNGTLWLRGQVYIFVVTDIILLGNTCTECFDTCVSSFL